MGTRLVAGYVCIAKHKYVSVHVIRFKMWSRFRLSWKQKWEPGGTPNNYVGFSGFSVGSCLNRKRVLCYQLMMGKLFTSISIECFSLHQGKSGESVNKQHCLQPLPTIHVLRSQRLMRIVPPLLPPHHCDPATRYFQSPSQLRRSSKGVIWICRASFTKSSCPCCGWAPMSFPSGFGGGSSMYVLLQLTSLSSQASLSSFSLISSLHLVSPM